MHLSVSKGIFANHPVFITPDIKYHLVATITQQISGGQMWPKYLPERSSRHTLLLQAIPKMNPCFGHYSLQNVLWFLFLSGVLL